MTRRPAAVIIEALRLAAFLALPAAGLFLLLCGPDQSPPTEPPANIIRCPVCEARGLSQGAAPASCICSGDGWIEDRN